MVYKVTQRNNIFYVVEERNITSGVEVVQIKSYVQRDEAKQMMRKLNGGCGFNGWTPNFFLNGVSVK